MKTFSLTVTSPDGVLYRGEVVKLDVRGSEGELAVMAGHAGFITTIKEAPITIWPGEGEPLRARSQGGILTVGKDRVILLSSTFQIE